MHKYPAFHLPRLASYAGRCALLWPAFVVCFCLLALVNWPNGAFAADDLNTSLLPPPPTGIAPLTLETDITQTGSYASNTLLSVTPVKPLYGSTTSPEFSLKAMTPASLLGLDARIDRSFFNQRTFNSTDAHTNTTLSTQNKRWFAGFVQNMDYDTTRTSETTGFGLNPLAIRHLGLSEAPQIIFNPTETDSFSLRGAITTSTYANKVYTDYTTLSFTPSYTRRLDERNTVSLLGNAQRYLTTSNSGTRVDTIGPSIGWASALSQRLQVNFSVGRQISRQIQPLVATTPWKQQSTFAGGLTFRGEQDTIKIDASRAQFPYGNGTQALQTAISGTETHNLTPRLSLNVGANYNHSTYPVSSSGTVKTLTGASTGLTYNVTRDLDLKTTYEYRHESFITTPQTAHDNAVTVNLVFHPNLWTLDR